MGRRVGPASVLVQAAADQSRDNEMRGASLFRRPRGHEKIATQMMKTKKATVASIARTAILSSTCILLFRCTPRLSLRLRPERPIGPAIEKRLVQIAARAVPARVRGRVSEAGGSPRTERFCRWRPTSQLHRSCLVARALREKGLRRAPDVTWIKKPRRAGQGFERTTSRGGLRGIAGWPPK
jgi:hypothetical protein